MSLKAGMKAKKGPSSGFAYRSLNIGNRALPNGAGV